MIPAATTRSAVLLGLFLLCLGPVWFAPARAGTVAVEVTLIRNAQGTVLIGICDTSSYLEPKCTYHGRTHAVAGSLIFEIHDVGPGDYAVQVIHDENGNDEFDRNFFGVPKEGYGFSRNPDLSFGPPDFEAVAVTVGEDRTVVPVEVFYLFD